HSHKAVEVFFILSGNIEVLLEDGGKMSWVEASAGNLIEIPSKAKHAFRNSSQHPVINLLYTTSDHGRYFQEIGRPATSEASVSPQLSMKFSVSWRRRGVTATGLRPRRIMHRSALLSSRCLHQKRRNDNTRYLLDAGFLVNRFAARRVLPAALVGCAALL